MAKGYYAHHDARHSLIQRFNWGETIARLDDDYCTLEILKEDLIDLERKIEEQRKQLPHAVLDLYDQDRMASKLQGNS